MARILVIEDNLENLQLVVYLLEAFGHAVVAARDGTLGLAMAIRGDMDLILCDLHLPGIDGYEIARRLKADPSLARIPLVAVTASSMAGDRDRGIAAGFDAYVSKPIDPESFVREIDGFLKGIPRAVSETR